MRSTTRSLINALRILDSEIQSEDGVANAVVAEAATRLEEQQKQIQRWHDTLTPLMPSDLKSWHENNPSEWPEVTAWVITSQRERINQLESENDELRAALLLWENGGPLP
jgi:hypothetical protein